MHVDEGFHISSQVMSKVYPLDHQEDQPIFQIYTTIFSFKHFHVTLTQPYFQEKATNPNI